MKDQNPRHYYPWPTSSILLILPLLVALALEIMPDRHQSAENPLHVGSITSPSGLESSFLGADGTRSTQDVRRPWTKRSSDSQNRMSIRCAQWNASRAAAWQCRRVAVARPVRIDFCTNLRFFLAFRKRSEIGQATELSTLELAKLPK